MILLKNVSIRQRLTYIIMSISFISVLLTSLSISVIGVYNLRGNIIEELAVSASIVADRNEAALLFDDSEQARENLGVFTVKQTIVQACLYQDDGALFAQYSNDKYASEHRGEQIRCPGDTTQRVNVHRNIEIMQPIVKALGKIGYIYIESTQDEINKYIEKQTTISLVVAVTTLLVSYFLAINLQSAIARPVLNLADTAREVSIRKDYSIRAPLLGDAKEEFNNELVVLTHSFNDMLSEIEGRDRQLKEQNIDLEKAKNVAESANRSKSQFLANISHELRTPLNAIIGFSSILMNQLFGPLGDQKYLEYAKDINDSGGHLLDIINDILDLSKAEAGRLTLTFEEVHVAKTLNKCMTITA
ncbi:MAG: histidine kinase dimerization/phospho-acceptor domain-containing protein, partial [Alphaproteobacteria bacterium]